MRPLRLAVLRPGQPAEAAVWPADDDPRSVHAGARDAEGRIVAVGSLVPEGIGLRVRGMATAPEARGRGLGGAVLDELLAAAGDEPVWCNARPAAASLYARRGFDVVGEPFDVPGLGPHVRMELRR